MFYETKREGRSSRASDSIGIVTSSSNDSVETPPTKKPKLFEIVDEDEEKLMNFEKSRVIALAKHVNNDFEQLEKKYKMLEQNFQTLQKGHREEKRRRSSVDEEIHQEKINQLENDLQNLQKSGLNRFSMSNKKFFDENERACFDLYGFREFKFLVGFIEEVLDVKYQVPEKLSTKGGFSGSYALSDFEQVLLTMFYCNTEHNYSTIGSVFGVMSRNTVAKYIDRWLPVLGETGDMLSTFTHWIDTQALEEVKPEWYKILELNDIAAVIDGKDFMCETVRSDRYLNTAQASNKVNHSAFRLLTWSLPCGTVIQRTPGFFGRASEKAILRAWGNAGRLVLPVGTCILGDKGFDNTAGSYTNFNTTLHPSFLTDEQFSRRQVNHNMLICKKRYSCEVVYSRVVTLKKFQGILKREHFKYFESLAGWAHGIANICYADLQKVQL